MCWPEVLSSDVYVRPPRYLGEPRGKRLAIFRPGSRGFRHSRYHDPFYARDDMVIPYRQPMGMGMGMGVGGMGHMSGMGHMGHMSGIPPPLPPPPPGNYNNGMHSNGMMQPPMGHQLTNGAAEHGVVQLGNDMRGGQFDHGMNNRMHGGGQFGMGGQRLIDGPNGPRSPMPPGMRYGHGYGGGGWGSGSMFGSEDGYGSERGLYNRHSYGSSMDDFYPRHRPAYGF